MHGRTEMKQPQKELASVLAAKNLLRKEPMLDHKISRFSCRICSSNPVLLSKWGFQ